MNLSRREGILSIVLLITLLIGISMALCIWLVLKPSRKDSKDDKSNLYITAKDRNLLDITNACNCNIYGLTYKFEPLQDPGHTKLEVKKSKNNTEIVQSESEPFNISDNLARRIDNSDGGKMELVRNRVGEDTYYDNEKFTHRNLPEENLPSTKNRIVGATHYDYGNTEDKISRDEMRDSILKISEMLMNISDHTSPMTTAEIIRDTTITTAATTTITTTVTTALIPETTSHKYYLNDEFMKSIWNAINAKKDLEIQTPPTMVRKREFSMEAPHCFVPNVKQKEVSDEEDRQFQEWKFHSSLISISAPRYLDDMEDRNYLCAGVIIDKSYAVTGTKCLRDRSLEVLKIRSESSYWSKNGIVHDVVDLVQLSELTVLKVFPQFNVDYKKILNLTENVSNIDRGTSAGWITEHREKFAKYSVLRWGNSCGECKEAKLMSGESCKNFLGDPLFDNTEFLVGIRACENKFVEISDVRLFLTRLN